MGGTTVVGIQCFYKQQQVVSETEFECHASGIILGVALRGTIVKE